jgi:hypothetical protein
MTALFFLKSIELSKMLIMTEQFTLEIELEFEGVFFAFSIGEYAPRIFGT